jgi:hypothetical protein
MELNSPELKQANWVAPNATYIAPIKLENNINDQIRSFILMKDPSLYKSYELAYMKTCKNQSGLMTLIALLRILKEEFISKYREDNIKNLTIRKNFDSIIANLECMEINKLDISSDVLNTLILAFLSKNFLINEPKSTDNF